MKSYCEDLGEPCLPWRGYKVRYEVKQASNKFIGCVEQIFKICLSIWNGYHFYIMIFRFFNGHLQKDTDVIGKDMYLNLN